MNDDKSPRTNLKKDGVDDLMHKVIHGKELVDVKTEINYEQGVVGFPCGCLFKINLNADPVHGGPSIVLDRIYPEECPLTWALLSAGRTTGVFQLESHLGKSYAEKLQPEMIEHIAALLASIRPGVLKVKDADGVNMAEHLCYRKNGLEPIIVKYPAIEDLLAPTYQSLIYQETVLHIVKRLAAFLPTEADSLRSSIGKKKVDKIREVGRMFVDKAEELGIVSREEATQLFSDIEKSGKYLFAKAHSVGYALSTFETAYLKCHFPINFFTSYLEGSKHKGGKTLDEIRRLVRDARRFGIQILPPKFNDLNSMFSTDGTRIRFGLANINDVGEKMVERAKEKIDPTLLMNWSWYEFLTLGSSLCGSKMLTQSIKAGALDNYQMTRQRMLWEVENWSALTSTEQEKLTKLGEPLMKTVPIKEKRKEVNPETGRSKTVEVKVGEQEVMLDEARPTTSLEEAVAALLERPGAVTKGRREKVEAILDLLRKPPRTMDDHPYMITKMEEELMGVSLTTTNVAHVDSSVADTTIKEYINGKDDEDMTMVVEVMDFNEREAKSGENIGRKWASLAVTDGESILEDVVAYTASWENVASVLSRPGAVVAIQGKRHWQNGKSFVINNAWSVA